MCTHNYCNVKMDQPSLYCYHYEVFLVILHSVVFSFSPEIDIGQIEGAIVMGLGHFLLEEYKYDPDSGRALTINTWVGIKHSYYILN